MGHGWEPVVHVCRDLIALFGKAGAEILICAFFLLLVVLFGYALIFGYLVLRFGEATFGGALRFALEAFKVFRYQPGQKTHPSIRIELYFDAVLIVVILICLIGLLGHALVPWVTEHSERQLFEVLVSSAIIFILLGTVSITIAARVPHD